MEDYDPLGRGNNNKLLSPTLGGGGMEGGNLPLLSSSSSGVMSKGIGSFGETLRGIVDSLREYAGKRIGKAHGMTRAQGDALKDAGGIMGMMRGQDASILGKMMETQNQQKGTNYLGLGNAGQPISGPSETAEEWMRNKIGGGL